MTDQQSAEQSTTEQQETTALRQAAESVQTQQETRQQTTEIPEKFRVTRDDGSVDYEASSAKMAQSYSYLEKRLGSGDAPPKTPDDYQVQFSEGVDISFDDLKQDEGIQTFMEGAHKLGMTNAQVSYVLDQYMQALPQDLEAFAEMDSRECVSVLVNDLGKQGADEALEDAYRAVTMVAGDDAEYLMDRYGNDPIAIKYLAKFGAGLREDSPPMAMQTIDPQEFSGATHDLRQQLIDMPKSDPRRAQVQAKLDELYSRQYGTANAYGLG